MNEQNPETRHVRPKRNIWNLILGILFLAYGSFRLYQKTQEADPETFSVVLAIAFILFGIYDLYKYFKGR